MHVLTQLWPYLWRTYWRGHSGSSPWKGANTGVLIALAVLMLVCEVAVAGVASITVASGSDHGPWLAEMTLVGVMAAWTLLPLFLVGTTPRGLGLVPRRLLQFPISIRSLLLVAVAGHFVQPVYWIVAAITLVGLVPFFFFTNTAASLAGAGLFVAASALFSWALGFVTSSLLASRWGRQIFLLAATVASSSFFVVFFLDYELGRDGVAVSLLGLDLLNIDAGGASGLLLTLRGLTPAAWPVQAGLEAHPGPWLLALAALVALTGLVAAVGFRRSILSPVESGARRSRTRTLGALPGLPRALGAATHKEIHTLSQTMDALLGFTLGAGGALYTVLAAEPDPRIVLGVFVFLAAMTEPAMIHNLFGLDGRAADRYRLLPLSGAEVLLSKNLAFFIVYACQVLPLVAAAAFQWGLARAGALVLGLGSYLLLNVIWGNSVSLKAPVPREFYNNDSKEQVGGVVSILYSSVIWLVPASAGAVCLLFTPWLNLPIQGLILVLCLLFYKRSLASRGADFERLAEEMRQSLTH